MLTYRAGVFLISKEPLKSKFIGYRPKTGCIDEVDVPVDITKWYKEIYTAYAYQNLGSKKEFECSYTKLRLSEILPKEYAVGILIDLPNNTFEVKFTDRDQVVVDLKLRVGLEAMVDNNIFYDGIPDINLFYDSMLAASRNNNVQIQPLQYRSMKATLLTAMAAMVSGK